MFFHTPDILGSVVGVAAIAIFTSRKFANEVVVNVGTNCWSAEFFLALRLFSDLYSPKNIDPQPFVLSPRRSLFKYRFNPLEN